MKESLESTGCFPPLSGEEGSQEQPQARPQAHVWTMFQLVQHYDMQGRTGGLLTLTPEQYSHDKRLLRVKITLLLLMFGVCYGVQTMSSFGGFKAGLHQGSSP